MRLFGWLAAGPLVAAFDLRPLGWRLLTHPGAAVRDAAPVLLVRREGLALGEWLAIAGGGQPLRARVLMLDVGDSEERARLLRLGFGDALAPGVALFELEARALRALDLAARVPRYRQHGALRLDLIAREAHVAGRAAGLHPREFALLWRLAENPGAALSPRELLREVWNLSFRPETNSLAVHISRLRAKLRLCGLDGLIETSAAGGYLLAALPGPQSPPESQSVPFIAAPPAPRAADTLALDAYLRLGNEEGAPDQTPAPEGATHAAPIPAE